MVFLDLSHYAEKIGNINKSLTSEATAFQDVFLKSKSRIPANQFTGAVNKVKKNLKILSTLDLANRLTNENVDSITSSNLHHWNEVFDFCCTSGRLVNSTCNACLNAFAHCEQNVKVGHFLMFYVSLLAILARLHTLVKALSITILRLAFDIKVELTKVSSSDNLGDNVLNKIKQEILEKMDMPTDYGAFLKHDLEESEEITVHSHQEDMGVPVSRFPSIDDQQEHKDTVNTKAFLEENLKAANSIRALRLLIKDKCGHLSEERQLGVAQLLQEADNMCKSLLEAKRLVLCQTAEQLFSLVGDDQCKVKDPMEAIPEVEKIVNRNRNSPLEQKTKDKTLLQIGRILEALPIEAKTREKILSSLPSLHKMRKKRLMKMVTKAEERLLSLKENGQVKAYKRRVDLLTKKIGGMISGQMTVASGHNFMPLGEDTSDLLLNMSQDSADDDIPCPSKEGNKVAFEKILKSCNNLDGLLQVWDDILTNKREDLTLLLPSKVKRSKLNYVKNRLTKLKMKDKTQNLKNIVKKILIFTFKK